MRIGRPSGLMLSFTAFYMRARARTFYAAIEQTKSDQEEKLMFKGLFFFIKQGWKYDKRYILWRVLYQFVNSMIPVAAALAPKYIIDELMGEARPERLVLYVGILAGYTFAAGALSVFFSMDGFTRRCRVAAEFDSEMHRRLARADLERLEDPDFLDMQEKAKKFLYSDWHGFGYLLDSALNIVGQVFTLLGVAAIIATLDIRVVLIFVALTGVGTFFEGRAKEKAAQLTEQVSADQRGWMYYSGLFDNAAYAKEIRLNAIGDWLLKRERKYFTRVIQNLKQQNDGFIRSGLIGSACTLLQQCAAYAWLIVRTGQGAISVGSFTMYVSAVTTFASALRTVLDNLTEIRVYDRFYDRLDEYLSVPARLRGDGGDGDGDGQNDRRACGSSRKGGRACGSSQQSGRADSQGGSLGKERKKQRAVLQGEHVIEFQNVSFRYSGSSTWALRNVSLTLKPGMKLAVVGENGAGKTTFVKLLTRLYDPTEGEILMDGVPIREYDYDSYMEVFSAVFQDYRLFSFSLEENVKLARPEDAGRVENALRRVGFGEKLDSLPKGIHTEVYKNFDETGFEPSGGEGQRIALARALYKDAAVVVLDEPTAALDPRAEFELYRHFDELTEGKTAVYISHRLSSTRFCDEIAVFAGGRIVERGTHEELMRRQGRYAELFEMQAQFYV